VFLTKPTYKCINIVLFSLNVMENQSKWTIRISKLPYCYLFLLFSWFLFLGAITITKSFLFNIILTVAWHLISLEILQEKTKLFQTFYNMKRECIRNKKTENRKNKYVSIHCLVYFILIFFNIHSTNTVQ
jgi:hypothetical protein